MATSFIIASCIYTLLVFTFLPLVPANHLTDASKLTRHCDGEMCDPPTSEYHVSTDVAMVAHQGEVVTCEGICGLARDAPCSCHVKCMIFANCCENFTSDCPALTQKGHEQFAALITSDILCSGEGYLQVASCPRPNRSWDRRRHAGFRSRGKNYVQDDDLNSVLGNTPVTNLVTGITYVNRSVGACHEDFNTELVTWDVEMAFSHFRNPDTRESLEGLFEFSTAIYHPPKGVEELHTGGRCMAGALGKCDPSLLQIPPATEELCHNFISYVSAETGAFQKTLSYKNRFCYACNVNNDHRFYPILDFGVIRGNRFDFSVLMHLNDDGVKMTSRTFIPLAFQDRRDLIPWKELYCNIPVGTDSVLKNNTETYQNTRNLGNVCTINTCGSGFNIRPDGKCKAAHRMFVGLADIGNHGLKSTVVKQLPRFVKCFLENYVGFEIVNTSKTAKILNGRNRVSGIQKIVYVVEMFLYMETSHQPLTLFELFREDTQKLTFLDMAGAFKLFQKSRPADPDSTQVAETNELQRTRLADLIELYRDVKKLLFSERAGSNTTVQATICSGQELAELFCYEDTVSEARVRRYINSTCFTEFVHGEESTNGQAPSFVPLQSLITLLIFLPDSSFEP